MEPVSQQTPDQQVTIDATYQETLWGERITIVTTYQETLWGDTHG